MGAVRLRLTVALGGVIGATIRLVTLGATGDHRGWLWLTLGAVNVVGCLVVGAGMAAADRWRWPSQWRLALTVGLCGGLTTFSTVAIEVALAFDDGAGPAAAAVGWAVVSLGLGVVAVAAGRTAVVR